METSNKVLKFMADELTNCKITKVHNIGMDFYCFKCFLLIVAFDDLKGES